MNVKSNRPSFHSSITRADTFKARVPDFSLANYDSSHIENFLTTDKPSAAGAIMDSSVENIEQLKPWQEFADIVRNIELKSLDLSRFTSSKQLHLFIENEKNSKGFESLTFYISANNPWKVPQERTGVSFTIGFYSGIEMFEFAKDKSASELEEVLIRCSSGTNRCLGVRASKTDIGRARFFDISAENYFLLENPFENSSKWPYILVGCRTCDRKTTSEVLSVSASYSHGFILEKKFFILKPNLGDNLVSLDINPKEEKTSFPFRLIKQILSNVVGYENLEALSGFEPEVLYDTQTNVSLMKAQSVVISIKEGAGVRNKKYLTIGSRFSFKDPEEKTYENVRLFFSFSYDADTHVGELVSTPNELTWKTRNTNTGAKDYGTRSSADGTIWVSYPDAADEHPKFMEYMFGKSTGGFLTANQPKKVIL